MLNEGDRVPKFEAADADGNTVRSYDLLGRRHVIYFYPRDFTPGCTREADEFVRDYAKFQKSGIEILGISPDDVESHRKFCSKMKIKFPLLSDTDKEISKAFGVWKKKKFMGREYMGVARSTFLINEKGTVFKLFSSVKPAGHSKQVLDAFMA